MTHSFAAYILLSNFDSALFADLTLMADTLVLSAIAFPVLGRTKDLFAEKTVSLGFGGTVVDSLGLFNLAVRP